MPLAQMDIAKLLPIRRPVDVDPGRLRQDLFGLGGLLDDVDRIVGAGICHLLAIGERAPIPLRNHTCLPLPSRL